MDFKKICLVLIFSSIIIGSVCAAGVNDFNIDDSFKNIYNGTYYSIYADNDQNSGISIYKNVDDDVYDDLENDEVLDNVIHHDGREYITVDDDLKLDKNSDNIANFTDFEHGTHGLSEVFSQGGEEYIAVFWAKDSSNIDNKELNSLLNEFNKKNDVKAIEF